MHYKLSIYKVPTTYEELEKSVANTGNKKRTLRIYTVVSKDTILKYSDRAEQLYNGIIKVSIATENTSNTKDLSKITEKQIISEHLDALPYYTKILLKGSRPQECV